MAGQSVAILSASGHKIAYQSYRAAQESVANGRASWVSSRCVRLAPEEHGVKWRVRRSGKYGPLVMQADHLDSGGDQ